MLYEHTYNNGLELYVVRHQILLLFVQDRTDIGRKH